MNPLTILSVSVVVVLLTVWWTVSAFVSPKSADSPRIHRCDALQGRLPFASRSHSLRLKQRIMPRQRPFDGFFPDLVGEILRPNRAAVRSRKYGRIAEYEISTSDSPWA